jgi:magnesium transporter
VTQLSTVLTGQLLITHHYEPVPAVEGLRRLLAKHEVYADRGPDYLFHLILDTTVDDYAPVLDHLDDSLDEIEVEVMERPSRELLLKLLGLKRYIIRLRKTLIYEREVLARLIRGEFTLIEDREMAYYRNVYDHLVRFTELIEASREMVSDLMQTHLSSISNRLNEIMKALTMVSTVVLPMTLVAGVYGMNVEGLPGGKEWWGLPLSMVLMGVTGVATFWWFRWRRWI